MTKMMEIKKGNKTVYKIVPDNYKEEKKEIPQRDLTTGGAKVFSFGLTKNDYERIFKKKQKSN